MSNTNPNQSTRSCHNPASTVPATKRKRTSVDLGRSARISVQSHADAAVTLLMEEGVDEDDEDLVNLKELSARLLRVRELNKDGPCEVKAIPFADLRLADLPGISISYHPETVSVTPAQVFREIIAGEIVAAFPDVTVLDSPIQTLKERSARIHARVNMQKEAGRRFHVNQVFSDVMDYCEDGVTNHSFCVVPELALARSEKDLSSLGFHVEGVIKPTTPADPAVDCVTILTGIADYLLWSFRAEKPEIRNNDFAFVQDLKILSQIKNRTTSGHIVAVESKRLLNTPSEINAAIAQVAGECVVIAGLMKASVQADVPFIVTSGLKWIFGVLSLTGGNNQRGSQHTLWHSDVLQVVPGSTTEGPDEGYKAVFQALLIWITTPAAGIQRMFNE
ncbi:hypothetical protein FIBSPDRAFT_931760 [Athelia psychrophila]|uniref:Uncharacterized protein n=1 Tax=Athelia psychrophila TaxID=1759441 RepID=A0A166JZ66_9AGAM|nr:hypothetical protein FIBSPDRAFT_931760 [Fibularhizoctonia sp. CBS 109695]